MSTEKQNSVINRAAYFLRIDAGGSPYDIQVNNCPIVQDDDGYSVATRLPINVWLRAGENALTVSMARSPDARANVT